MGGDYARQIFAQLSDALQRLDKLETSNVHLKEELETQRTLNRALQQEITCVRQEAAKEKSQIREEFQKEREGYQGEIQRLKSIINKDSSNSSKPPSSNGFRKVIVNNREKSQKKPH